MGPISAYSEIPGLWNPVSRANFLRGSNRIYFFSLSVPTSNPATSRNVSPHSRAVPSTSTEAFFLLTHPFHYGRISHNATYTCRLLSFCPFLLPQRSMWRLHPVLGLSNTSHPWDASWTLSVCFPDVHPSTHKPPFHEIICYLYKTVHEHWRGLFSAQAHMDGVSAMANKGS